MDRLNLDENREEDRTGKRCKVFGRSVVSGDTPIEHGNSWFSPKQL